MGQARRGTPPSLDHVHQRDASNSEYVYMYVSAHAWCISLYTLYMVTTHGVSDVHT